MSYIVSSKPVVSSNPLVPNPQIKRTDLYILSIAEKVFTDKIRVTYRNPGFSSGTRHPRQTLVALKKEAHVLCNKLRRSLLVQAQGLSRPDHISL